MKRSFVAALLLLLSITVFAQYAWENVPLNVGYYSTQLAISPANGNIRYLGTSEGGIFSWDNTDKKWVAMLDKFGPEETHFYGVDGIAVHPTDPNVAIAALGKYQCYPGVIIKTENGFKSYDIVGVINNGSDQTGYQFGPSIQFDPNNGDRIYAGTRSFGLAISDDGGETWNASATVPAGHIGDSNTCYWSDPGIGIRSIAIDKNSGMSGANTAVVAVCVYDNGTFASNDGGGSFTYIGGPDTCHKVTFDAGGNIWVTSDEGVHKFDGMTWTDVRPRTTTWNAIITHPTDVNKVLVSQGSAGYYQDFYKSNDGGANWTRMTLFDGNMQITEPIPWAAQRDTEYFQAFINDITLLPNQPDKMLFVDRFGVWQSPNGWDTLTTWNSINDGLEGSQVMRLITPPSGAPLFSTLNDYLGFRHADPDILPTNTLTERTEGYDIAYQEQDPNNMALLDDISSWANQTRLMLSTDNGITWSAGNLPAGALGGHICISANDKDNMVYLPAYDYPYFTTDGGATWTQSNGVDDSIQGSQSLYNYDRPLQADKVDGNTFYLLDHQVGNFYKSTDGGANFVLQNAVPLGSMDRSNFEVGPTAATSNLVYINYRWRDLKYSTDGGKNFADLFGWGDTRGVSFGAPLEGETNPTLYIYGEFLNNWGVYRSKNLGQFWSKITGSRLFGDEMEQIAADKQTPGTIYLATRGRGIIRGKDVTPIVGITESIIETFKVYPNPTSQYVTIDLLDDVEPENITIFSESGQLIVENVKELKIDVSQYAQGNYYVYLKSNYGEQFGRFTVVR